MNSIFDLNNFIREQLGFDPIGAAAREGRDINPIFRTMVNEIRRNGEITEKNLKDVRDVLEKTPIGDMPFAPDPVTPFVLRTVASAGDRRGGQEGGEGVNFSDLSGDFVGEAMRNRDRKNQERKQKLDRELEEVERQ